MVPVAAIHFSLGRRSRAPRRGAWTAAVGSRTECSGSAAGGKDSSDLATGEGGAVESGLNVNMSRSDSEPGAVEDSTLDLKVRRFGESPSTSSAEMCMGPGATSFVGGLGAVRFGGGEVAVEMLDPPLFVDVVGMLSRLPSVGGAVVVRIDSGAVVVRTLGTPSHPGAVEMSRVLSCVGGAGVARIIGGMLVVGTLDARPLGDVIGMLGGRATTCGWRGQRQNRRWRGRETRCAILGG